MGPAEWAESRINITRGKYQGRLSYRNAPYCRQIIEHFSPYDPYTEITIMASAQWGKTSSIIEPGISYRIEQHPTQMAYLTGHTSLSKEGMERLDMVFESANIDRLIFSQAKNKRNVKSGNTDEKKEFPDGSLISGSLSNPKLLRQRDYEVVIADDIDAAKMTSESDGDIPSQVRARTKSYGTSKKIFWVSTPTIYRASMIEALFEDTDKRFYFIPCPNCGQYMPLEFDIQLPNGERAGLTWRDEKGILIPGTVEYVCPHCANAFKERKKWECNQHGVWTPTAIAKDPLHCGYHMSSLYSMPGMDNWEAHVRQYLDACPPGQPKNPHKYQSFLNMTLGLSYKPDEIELKSAELEKNRRNYLPGIIPESISIENGNGKIVALTCAADLNGVIEDGRLDYEVNAISESGAYYSIIHGSIGTFIPRENTLAVKVDRQRWTYEDAKEYCIWAAFEQVLNQVFSTDTGRKMKIMVTLLDSGKYTQYAYKFCDTHEMVFPVKGDENEHYKFINKDAPWYKKGSTHRLLKILYVGIVKETFARNMQLVWSEYSSSQPPGFMNFPQATGDLYTYDKYFSHFEAEKRESNDKTGYRWVKKNSAVQNHFYDCKIYNLVAERVIIEWFQLATQNKLAAWKDVAEYLVALH